MTDTITQAHRVRLYPLVESLSHVGTTDFYECDARRANITRQTMLMCGGYPYRENDDFSIRMVYGYLASTGTFTPIVLTGTALVMTIYDRITRETVLTRQIAAREIVIESQSTSPGRFTVYIDADDSIEPGIYQYDIVMTKTLLSTTIISGQFEAML